MKKTLLVINRKSGSYTSGIEHELTGGLAAAGEREVVTLDCSECDLPASAQLDRDDIDLVAIFGGDGSLNSVMRPLRGWGGNILVLPGGTANLLSHKLHGERTAGEILQQLGNDALVTRTLDCVEGREWIGLSEVLAGPGALWADVREKMRDYEVIDMVKKSVEAIETSQDGPQVRVFAGEEEIGRPEGYAGVRISPVDGALFPQGYRIESMAEFLQQGAAILGRNFREGPCDELRSSHEIVFKSTGEAALHLMIDGERFEGEAEEKFVLAPLGLSLLGSPS